MSKFLDSTGLETLWDLIKSAFASSLSINNRTISLKNGKDEILGSTTLPFYGVYFVKGTQTSATGTWTGNLPEVNSLYDGLTIAYFLPYAGSGNATLTLTLGTGTSTTTTQPEPVYYNNETRASTNYGKGSTVVLTWVSNATTGYEAVGSATGRWTRCDYNSNTVPSAYCTTAASTAAKAATCTNYYLLNNSYIHVLISQTNTAKSALTLNINSKGSKPIYINGTASSASNYTLPAGTYIVFYDGTNYYFNTNGNLPGHIDGSSITGDISADNLNVDLYNEAFRAVRILAWPSAVSTGGWKRLCLIGGYNAYAVGKILINGGYSYGRPTNAQCDFYYNYNKAGIKQTSGIVNDTILALRLVYNGSSKWWLDVKMGANSSGAMSNQYITLIGAFSVTNITEDNTFLTEDPATTVALCELRTMVDTPTITVDLTSGTASAFTGADMTTGVTGILPVANGGTGQTTAKDASNAFINALDTETTELQDGDYFIAQTAGGGTTTTTYKRKPLSALETYIRSATVDYFTCDTASGTVAKNVTVNKTLRYYEGAEFIVKFTNGNTVANPTFSVNSLAARPIYLNGLPVPTDYIKSGDVVRLVYHDTSFDIIDRGLNMIKAYDNHIRYYIHRTDGSDTNDGLTTSTPFKTIEKFLEVTANAGYTDCRCTILKDGAYVLNKQALNNVTLHIKVDDSVNGDVILQGNYNVPEDWIMYNAHVKLTGTANAPIVYQPYSTQGIYFENSAVTLDYVKFKCRMQGFGCYIKADNIEANTLHFSGCTGYLATVAITNNSHTRHGILLDRGCNMRVSGTFTIGALTDGVASSDSNKDKNYFLNIQDSDIVLQSSYPTTLYNFNNNSTIDITNDSNKTTYSYAYGMRLSNAEITGTRIRLASYVSRGVNKTMLADEESDINVTWGGGSGDSANGRAGFNSLYGFESIVLNTDATDLISASAIKTWTIPKATIVSAVASDHPNVGTSAYPYKILAVIPVSTNDNRVIIKNSTVDSSTGDITVVGRNVTATNLQNLGIYATVNVLYTMSPFSITYHS